MEVGENFALVFRLVALSFLHNRVVDFKLAFTLLCHHGERNRDDGVAIAQSMVKQLARNNSRFDDFDRIVDIFNHHMNVEFPAVVSIDEIWLIQTFKKIHHVGHTIGTVCDVHFVIRIEFARERLRDASIFKWISLIVDHADFNIIG